MEDMNDENDNEAYKFTIWSFVTSTIKLVAMLSTVVPIFIKLVIGIVKQQEQKQKKESESQVDKIDPLLPVTGGPQATLRNENDNTESRNTDQRVLNFHILSFREKYNSKDPKEDNFQSTPIEVDGFKWFLNIYPHGRSCYRDPYFYCSLKLSSDMRCCVEVNQCFIKIPAIGGNNLDFSPRIFRPGKGYGFWFVNSGMESYLSKNEALTITVILGRVTPIPNKMWFPPLKQSQSNFIFTSESACVIIAVPDGEDNKCWKEFPAHLYVLQNHVPVLYDILCNEFPATCDEADSSKHCSMDENDGTLVKVPIKSKYVDANSFEAIYEYMYSGQVPESSKDALSDTGMPSIKRLLLAASYLGCIGMKLHAESILVDQFLSLENAVDMAFFAESNTCALLKESALMLLTKDCACAKNPKGWRATLKGLAWATKPKGWKEILQSSDFTDDLALYQSQSIKETFSGYPMKTKILNQRKIKKMDVKGLRQCIVEKDTNKSQNMERLDGTRSMLISTLTELCRSDEVFFDD